ncbi:type II toxin-antitoxin system HicB family antitoxin [Duganella fentianensis]|uniref:type II toxin-antitoxin system HicB family antitoxin n=1 Tax=Duganella fentianensis TaxID=2692177 RepID=UPI0032B1E0FF
MKIPVVVFKDEGSVFGTCVPDIRGLHSCGRTLDEALQNTCEALRNHIELLLEMGEEVEVHPSPLRDLQSRSDYAGGTWHFLHIEPALLLPQPAAASSLSSKPV